MKIAYFSPSFYPATKYGGPIFSSLNTCRELLNLGLDIDIHTTNVDRHSRLNVTVNAPVELKELNYNKVTYHKETFTDRFSLNFFLSAPFAVKNADIVHTQSVFSICTPLAIFWSFFYSKQVVVSPRGSLGLWCLNQGSRFKKLWLSIFFKPFLKKIYWHVTADSEKNDVLSVFPNIKDHNFIIIPNGINRGGHSLLDKNTLFDKLGFSAPNRYILSSGRIDDKKGFDYTIRALKYIDDISLLIMGEDYGSKNDLLKLASELDVSRRVKFLGHITDEYKWSLYAHADVFSLNSRHENFGNVYLESLSVGTPIVASIYTPWAFINDTKAGYCVENSPKKIASAIKSIINSSSFDKENCLSVAQKFYWDSIAKQFINEYKRVLYVNKCNHFNL